MNDYDESNDNVVIRLIVLLFIVAAVLRVMS